MFSINTQTTKNNLCLGDDLWWLMIGNKCDKLITFLCSINHKKGGSFFDVSIFNKKLVTNLKIMIKCEITLSWQESFKHLVKSKCNLRSLTVHCTISFLKNFDTSKKVPLFYVKKNKRKLSTFHICSLSWVITGHHPDKDHFLLIYRKHLNILSNKFNFSISSSHKRLSYL